MGLSQHCKMHVCSLRFVLGALLMIMMTSCGFHLRGQVGLPPQMSKTQLTGLSERDALALALRQALRANAVTLVESAAQATALLRVLGREEGKRVLSVGGNGKVREYELYLSVSFDVKTVEGAHVAVQTLTLTREFIFDEADVLGKSQEELLLREDMYKDMAQLIMYRLQGSADALLMSAGEQSTQ